jgi:predicted transcriptional regulator
MICRRMTTSNAVRTVLSERLFTKYKLAQILGCSATSVNQWLNKTKMGKQYAQEFKNQFSIEVTDATQTTSNKNS